MPTSSAVHLPGAPTVAAVLLKYLDEVGGTAKRQDTYGPIAQRMAMTTAQLAKTTSGSKNAWQVRVNWARMYLAGAGFLHSPTPGLWAITESGRQVLGTADLATPIKRGYKRYKLAQPTPTPAVIPSAVAVDAPAAADIGAVASLVELASESSNPEAFENAVANAMVALGFAAQHIGGSGDTDILVQAPFATPPYSVVVDAKTTKHSKVGDSQIHWHHIEQHRKDHLADYAAVVATGFHGGLVSQKAMSDSVSLLSATSLQTVLAWHAEVIFSQEDLRVLFSPTADGLSEHQALRRPERNGSIRRVC